MKHLLTTLALMPALAFAHGKHADTTSDAQHSLLHAALSLEGLAALIALGAAVYFMFIKK